MQPRPSSTGSRANKQKASQANVGWLLHKPAHLRLVAVSVLNLAMQLAAFLVLMGFYFFAPSFRQFYNSNNINEIAFVFGCMFVALIGLCLAFAWLYPNLNKWQKRVGFSTLIILNILSIVYNCYLYDFKSAIMGSYLAAMPLLCLVLFNVAGLIRALLISGFFITFFSVMIALNIIPASPFFVVNVLSSPEGFIAYNSAVFSCLVLCLTAFLLAYDRLMVYRVNRESYLEYISQTDEVTGLLNRTHMNAILQSILLDLSHKGGQVKQVSVILVDIDFFKKVNDLYGHVVGDQVLITVAKVMQRVVEPYGYVSRHGGEEFLIVLPNRTLKEGEKIAQTLRSFIETTLAVHGDVNCYVTASFGVSHVAFNPYQVTCMKEVLKTVDQCLYRAKNTGRNKVVSINAKKR